MAQSGGLTTTLAGRLLQGAVRIHAQRQAGGGGAEVSGSSHEHTLTGEGAQLRVPCRLNRADMEEAEESFRRRNFFAENCTGYGGRFEWTGT